MNVIGRAFLRTLDEFHFHLHRAFQAFSFLDDGRRLVVAEELEPSAKARRWAFPDRVEIGWRGFSVDVVEPSELNHAMSGILRRSASWWIADSAAALRTAADSLRSQGFNLSQNGNHRIGRLEGTEGRVVIYHGPRTERGYIMSVVQHRTPDALEPKSQ